MKTNIKVGNRALAAAFVAISKQRSALPVEEIKLGAFVQKIKVCADCNGDGATDKGLCAECDSYGFHVAHKFYTRGTYDKSSKRYSLVDTDDTSREVFVKKGTRLFVDGTY